MKPTLPVRFTIERISDPASPRRHLAITNDGEMGWADGVAGLVVFAHEGAAKAFRRFRMNGAEADAKVVRHAVH